MERVSFLVMMAMGLVLAGYYEPSFEDYLQTLPDDAEVRAIVIMADQVDVPALEAELNARNADRQERHYVICSALMNKCNESQKDILAFLNKEKASGNIRRIRSFWLSNSIALECKKSTLEKVVTRPDVDIIHCDLPVELCEPVYSGQASDRISAYEWNLSMIRADTLWRKGITGLGRLAFSLDTGVYLQHICLLSRWRGRNGATLSQAWKDAIGSSPLPADPHGHGTHICGIMVGGYPGDTVGVAFGSQWIADNALNQGTGPDFDSDIRDAYNWACDPDSNPATVYDMPDACCNPWGVDARFTGYQDCDRRWNREIFNLEAAGCMLAFRAGSSGPTAQSIYSPANICTTATLNYCAGAVDNNEVIASFSSRGPTDCTMYDTTYWIKPEVSTPGINIRSCLRTGGYGVMGGSSMATAHLPGAFLLLRQYNTDASSDTIKKILMYTARDKGTPGEDNTYGWGIIDCAAALRAMPRSPSLAYAGYRIIDSLGNNNGRPDPGERVQMVDTIWSAGGRRATGIIGILRVRPGFNYVVIEDSTGFFGDLDSLEGPNRKGNNNSDRFTFRVLPNIPDNDSLLPFVISLRSNNNTYRVENLFGVWRGYEPVGITDHHSINQPDKFNLNVSSPASRLIRVTYDLPYFCNIDLKLFNSCGLVVKKLCTGIQGPGTKTVILNSKDFASGIYFLSLTYEKQKIFRKFILLK